MQQQVNLRRINKHHDTVRDMMATLSHVFSSISRGGSTQRVYGGRLFVVSARTNKRHHHHHPLFGSHVQTKPSVVQRFQLPTDRSG